MARKKSSSKSSSRKKVSTRKPAMRRGGSSARRTKVGGGGGSAASTRRGGDTGELSIEELHQALQSRVAELHARRDELLAELEEVDALIAEYGSGRPAGARGASGSASTRSTPASPSRGRSTGATGSTEAANGRGRGRARGAGGKSLVESLAEVLQDRELKVSDAVEAVKAAGYATKAENFRVIVNAALIKNTDIFRKVARGVYTAR